MLSVVACWWFDSLSGVREGWIVAVIWWYTAFLLLNCCVVTFLSECSPTVCPRIWPSLLKQIFELSASSLSLNDIYLLWLVLYNCVSHKLNAITRVTIRRMCHSVVRVTNPTPKLLSLKWTRPVCPVNTKTWKKQTAKRTSLGLNWCLRGTECFMPPIVQAVCLRSGDPQIAEENRIAGYCTYPTPNSHQHFRKQFVYLALSVRIHLLRLRWIC